MVVWFHRFNGLEFEQTPGDSDRQGSLACCRPWGCNEFDRAKQLNNNNVPANRSYSVFSVFMKLAFICMCVCVCL